MFMVARKRNTMPIIPIETGTCFKRIFCAVHRGSIYADSIVRYSHLCAEGGGGNQTQTLFSPNKSSLGLAPCKGWKFYIFALCCPAGLWKSQ